jgi:hypothetical protein
MVPCARSLPSLVVGPQVVGGLGTSTRVGDLYPDWEPRREVGARGTRPWLVSYGLWSGKGRHHRRLSGVVL